MLVCEIYTRGRIKIAKLYEMSERVRHAKTIFIVFANKKTNKASMSFRNVVREFINPLHHLLSLKNFKRLDTEIHLFTFFFVIITAHIISLLRLSV